MSAISLAAKSATSSESRVIQPIDFSEYWSLCHHLACVVEYIAHVGGEQLPSNQKSLDQARLSQTRLAQMRLDNLRKAKWYLLREISNKRPCVFSTFQNTQDHPLRITVEAAACYWELSSHLRAVLFNITTYQKILYRFPSTRVVYLKQALKHLKEEIEIYEPSQASLTVNHHRRMPMKQIRTIILKRLT